MKYWVYINDEILPQTYEAGELYTIKGFDGQTLICPEGAEEWTSADELINYTASRPKNLAEAVAAASNEPLEQQQEEPQAQEPAQEDVGQYYEQQEEQPAAEEQNPLQDYDGSEQEQLSQEAYYQQAADENYAPQPDNGLSAVLLEKIELLLSEVSGLKENIVALNEKTSELAQKVEQAETGRKNTPIVKDYAALKAFQSQEAAPINENDIPEEQLLSDEEETKKDEPVTSDPEDILESALENTIRMKAVADTVEPVVKDLTSNETINITDKKEEQPKEEKSEEVKEEETPEETPAEEPAGEQPQESEEELAEEESEDAIAEVVEGLEEEQPEEEPSREEQPAEENKENVQIAAVGTEEEEEILKTFAMEKAEEEKEKEEAEAQVDVMDGLETSNSMNIIEELEPSADLNTQEEPVLNLAPEEEDESSSSDTFSPEEILPADDTILLEPLTNKAPVENKQEPEAEPEPEIPAQEEEPQEQDALAALTSPSMAEEQTPAEEEQISQEEQAPAEPEQQPAEVAPATAETAVDDKFLKTFTSSIEDISLDQPTSIISDYVPPAITSDSPLYDEDAAPVALQPQVQGLSDLKNQAPAEEDVRQVKRIKPAAIKTVPMVAAGAPIGTEEAPSNIEEAVTELGQTSSFMKGLKAVGLMAFLLCVILGFVAILAIMGILPKHLSPVHYIIDKFAGSKVEETIDVQKPSVASAASYNEEETDSEKDKLDNVIRIVKNYTFKDGSTLEDKIRVVHASNYNQIEWDAEPVANQPFYQVVITLPPNKEGYNRTYRFNYNMDDGSLVPTSSESNNLMTMNIPQAAKNRK